MTESRLQKIWRDPVWSKVISVLIIAVSTVAYNFIVSEYKNVDFKTSFFNFWTLDIKLWVIAVSSIGLIIFYSVVKYFKSRKIRPFEYDDKTLELDVSLFNRVRNDILPQDGTIYWLRHNNFAGFSFEGKYLEPLDVIEWESEKSDFEFINPQLERIKQELVKEISEFNSLLYDNIFPSNTLAGRYSIPPELEIEEPRVFSEIVDSIHKKNSLFAQNMMN